MKLLITILLATSCTLHAQDSLFASLETSVDAGLSLTPDESAGYKIGHNPSRPYFLNYPVDAPIILAGTAWTLYAFPIIYSKDATPDATVHALDRNDLNSFDRWATKYYSDKADEQSNYIFYGSTLTPFLLMLDKNIRPDALKIGAMYWEAMAITGTLYTAGDYFVDRYRPLAYNTDAPMDQRTSGIARNSFFAGHVALVGTATFFTAAIYDRYHPASWTKWLVYGGAAVATGATAYMRHRAGRHFPSDIVIGALVGVGSGLLTPYFHKTKTWTGQRLGISPFYREDGVRGLSLAYSF